MEEAVARVALSYEACQLAETAGAAVPAAAEELGAARAVLEAADRYVESVVALARLRGSSWQEIAAALGRSEQAVRAQHPPRAGRGAAVGGGSAAGGGSAGRGDAAGGGDAAGRGSAAGGGDAAGRGSAAGGGGDWWREHLLCDPAEAAFDLDDWVRRHLDGDPGPAPVSGVLRRQATV
ncbi:hypothetical protein [Kribbella italica]|uniref:RNA polymerase subunit sigma-70 n=1 Tax=Kribbella italica TaxID=1540520 RepID=A0A7W9JEZ1_9ACTN|nr:hypothetical protein [Kribbella italica]MBB5840881.1 hypothetical protein [Kribbella italica]